MTKSYNIQVDCANCANLMEETIKQTNGVKNAIVNFITQKLTVEFEENVELGSVQKEIVQKCKQIEEDIEINF